MWLSRTQTALYEERNSHLAGFPASIMKPNRCCKTYRTSGVWSTNKSLIQYWLPIGAHSNPGQAALVYRLSRAGSSMISPFLSIWFWLPVPPTGRITWRLTHSQSNNPNMFTFFFSGSSTLLYSAIWRDLKSFNASCQSLLLLIHKSQKMTECAKESSIHPYS